MIDFKMSELLHTEPYAHGLLTKTTKLIKLGTVTDGHVVSSTHQELLKKDCVDIYLRTTSNLFLVVTQDGSIGFVNAYDVELI